MFYSHTYLYSITSLLDQAVWTNGQLDARLQSLLMSDQNSWFHGGGGRGAGGGGEGGGEGCWQEATNLYPESHEECPEVKCFALWTTHCFTKRIWKIYIYRLTINIFLGFLWERWGEDNFVRPPVISRKTVVMHSGEYFCVNFCNFMCFLIPFLVGFMQFFTI